MKVSLFSRVFLLLVIVVFSGCAPPPYRLQYDDAMKGAKYEEAYGIAKDVCEKNPSDALCPELKKTRSLYAGARFDKIKLSLSAETRPVKIKTLNDFKEEALSIKALSPEMETGQYIALVDDEIKKTLDVVKRSFVDADGFFKKGDIRRAFDAVNLARSLDAGVDKAVEEIADKMAVAAYNDGMTAMEAQDFKRARGAFEDVFYINPDYRGIKGRLDEARTKDSYEYHIGEAQSAMEGEEFETAIGFYKKSLLYRDDPETRELLMGARVGGVNALFNKGVEAGENGGLLSSAIAFIKAIAVFNDIPSAKRGAVNVPSSAISRLLSEMYLKGTEEKSKDRLGMAYLYMDFISKLQSDYPDIVAIKEGLKDEIRKRAMNSLAVIPFRGPTYNEDAGKVMTSKILHFLYQEFSNDIRILERTAMEALLKESEVKALQTGVTGVELGVLELLDADFLLIGDVVDYKIDAAITDSFKTVRVKTDVKKTLNPEYERWVSKGKMGDEPEKYVEEAVYENVRYKVSHHKKSVAVSVGYRVVNARGDMVHSGISDMRQDWEDTSSEGVEIGNLKIEAKMARVPNDGEIFKIANAEVIDKMGADLRGFFSKSEERLLKEAQELEAKGVFKDSIERFMKALFIAEKKGMDAEGIKKDIYEVVEKGGL